MGASVSECSIVQERLRVLAWAVEKMREATPGDHAGGRLHSRGPFAKEHDRMLTALIIAVQPFMMPLELDIPDAVYRPPGCATLVCAWKGTSGCPLCGGGLQRRECKRICENCGYAESCEDVGLRGDEQ